MPEVASSPVRSSIVVDAPIDRAFAVFTEGIASWWPPDHDRTSEVEVRFTSDGSGRTRDDLEHREIHRYGDGWEEMHSAVGSPDGWVVGLERFAARLASGG
jgi:uncharacterized protein YndB with AHSA1/START domain